MDEMDCMDPMDRDARDWLGWNLALPHTGPRFSTPS
jgi:hypothetical protein